MIIQILDQQNKPKALIRDFYDFNSTRRLNDQGTMQFSLSYDSYSILHTPLKKLDKIRVFHEYDYNQSMVIFSGYIYEIKPSNEEITLFCKDRLEYLKHRLFRVKKTYTPGTMVKNIVSDMISYLDGIHTLPFSLRLNNCELTLTTEVVIEIKTSLFDALQILIKLFNELEMRVVPLKIGSEYVDYMDISTQTWSLKDGIRRSNAYQEQNNNIMSRMRSSLADDTPTMIIDDKGVITEESFETLAYEKYVNEWSSLIDQITLPKIAIDAQQEDRWDLELWDRKMTSIITKTNWINIDYTAIIQGILYRADTTGVSISFEIGDKLWSQKNVLDKTLSHLSYMVNFLAKKSVG